MSRIRSELTLPVLSNVRENKRRKEFTRSIYQALNAGSRRAVGRYLDRNSKRKERRG